MAIYVGNLNYALKENDLEGVFADFGTVSSVKIIKDRYTGNSKGFGFVELENPEDEDSAINELDGKEVMGRNIKVNKARERKQ